MQVLLVPLPTMILEPPLWNRADESAHCMSARLNFAQVAEITLTSSARSNVNGPVSHDAYYRVHG